MELDIVIIRNNAQIKHIIINTPSEDLYYNITTLKGRYIGEEDLITSPLNLMEVNNIKKHDNTGEFKDLKKGDVLDVTINRWLYVY